MKILFCIPAYGGSVRAETMISVSTGVIHLSQNFPSAEIRLFTINMAEIARVRNIFASMLLDGYDALFMLDSDMGVPADTFSRLLASGHDVCGLTYPRRQIDLAKFHKLAQQGLALDKCQTGALSFIAAGGFVHNNGQIDIREGFLEMNEIPGGCMLIRKSAVELLWTKAPNLRQTQNISDMEADLGLKRLIRCFDNIQDGHSKYSEDISFCRYYRKAGGKVFALIDVSVAHHGDMKFEGRYSDLLLSGAKPA
ncbi:hypothetical protein GVN18_30100 [Pseudomonas sp. ODNR1LW]|nr:hypothetical protein [Pseudomonas sp. ODNR1LW]